MRTKELSIQGNRRTGSNRQMSLTTDNRRTQIDTPEIIKSQGNRGVYNSGRDSTNSVRT